MSLRRRFTLVLIPHSHSNVKEVGGPLIVGCGLLLTFVFILGIWSIGSTYVVSFFDGGKVANLERENIQLTSRLQALNHLSESFQDKMEALILREQETRTIVGLPDIHPDIRQLGVGGSEEVPMLSEESDSPSFVANQIHNNLDRLLHEVQLEQASLRAIEEKAMQDKDYWRHIPTVRPVQGPTSSLFGMRDDPFTGLRRMHVGLDIAARRGEKVRATADGRVIHTGVDVNYGRFVDIDHENGYRTRYGHLSAITIKRYTRIKRGDIIGLVGNTGRASGYHLHYEVLRNDRVIDPASYFFPEQRVVD